MLTAQLSNRDGQGHSQLLQIRVMSQFLFLFSSLSTVCGKKNKKNGPSALELKLSGGGVNRRCVRPSHIL